MCFFLFIFLFEFIYSYSIIKLPFKRLIPNYDDISPDNFPNLFFESNYYTEFTVGSNNQKIPMRLSFRYFHTFITISNYTGNFIKFDPDKSTTYQKTYGERYFSLINIKKGINSKEKFTLKNITNNDVYCNNIEFILATVPEFNISGEFGMKSSTKEEQFNRLSDFSFITNLYNNNYIKHKIFAINFFNKNSGEIIIGDKPSEYSNYDIDTFIEDYIPVDKNGNSWGLLNLVSTLNDKKLYFKEQYAEFEIESYVIKPHSCYKEKIDELFFNEQLENKKCVFVNNDEFSFYHCDKDVNLANFPQLNLYQRNFNYTFELNSSDLFENLGDRKYFLMNFFEDSKNDKWVFGLPFLKKYNFTYNFDSKTIGMYFGFKDKYEQNEEEEQKEQKEQKEQNQEREEKGFNVVWIIVIICLVIIIIMGIIIFLIVQKIPRKKRVNELEENLDYEEKNDNIENNNVNNQNENENELCINH